MPLKMVMMNTLKLLPWKSWSLVDLAVGGELELTKILFSNRTSGVLVPSMEAFTDITKLVEAFGLVESVLWSHKILSLSHDLYNQGFVHMREWHLSQSTNQNCLRNSLTPSQIVLLNRMKINKLYRIAFIGYSIGWCKI